MDNQELWHAVLGELELNISKASFTTWFKNTSILEISEDTVTIAVQNGFTKSWLENKYSKEILQALSNILKTSSIKKLIFKISHEKIQEQNIKKVSQVEKYNDDLEAEKHSSTNISTQNKTENGYLSLNPKYKFENFITGKQNELAKAASTAVAKNPGHVYNPLFLYGNVGLGKTHLMQSVANYIKENSPELKLAYVSSEHFTNDYVRSIQSGNMESFKKKYRDIDVLIVDDIQFMKGQERTQEEFFHTFNHLYQQNKQIVISSDRPPKSLPGIEDRLTSRFESGMIADIGMPDLETRMAILNSKIQEKELKLNISEEVVAAIANIAKSSVRELEGILNRVIATHQLSSEPISVEFVNTVLSGIIAKQKETGLSAKTIIKCVGDYYGIDFDQLTGNSRKKELVNPRQICMYLLRKELSASYPSIGSEIGGRDHTTAIHAYNKVCDLIVKDEKTRTDINSIIKKIHE